MDRDIVKDNIKTKQAKSVFSALIVMLLWASLFPVVKMGYAAYNIVSVAAFLLIAGGIYISNR